MGIMVYSFEWAMQDFVHQPCDKCDSARRVAGPRKRGKGGPATLGAIRAKLGEMVGLRVLGLRVSGFRLHI